MKTLCERLKYAMEMAGITSQSDLSRRSRVNQSIISKIIDGQIETSKGSGKLAAALGVSADWLINGTGSIKGGKPIEKVDASRLVDVWNQDGLTNDVISWHESIPQRYRAYIMEKDTGIIQAPAGTVVLTDPQGLPGNNDLVVTSICGKISVYRFLVGPAEKRFLAVDDGRIDPEEVKDPSWIQGVAEQLLVRKLRK